MMKFFTIFAVVAGLAFGLPQTAAYSAPVGKKAAKKHTATETESAVYEDKEQPDTAGLVSSLYNCELGNKLTIYRNVNDDQFIAMRWRDRLHRLLRVDTTTGAYRFENEKNGLVWIGIPSKGILLDSKNGRQLANECKPVQQDKPMTQEKAQKDIS